MKFTNIDDGLNWIMQKRREHASFEEFKEVMRMLGDPQNDFKLIHVGGTNGKGSLTCYIMNILKSLGYKVGTLTSPHYRTHLDRIRINNDNIDPKSFLDILNKYYAFFNEHHLSMFEMDYIIMCEYFKKEQVDFVITEVGMGGRLDSTNVVDHPLLSIIVTIGHDHMKELGDTLEKITYEKCGIIKDDSIVLAGRIAPELLKIIKSEADRHHAEYHTLGTYQKVAAGCLKYKDEIYHLKSLADYQLHNSALALEAVKILSDHGLTHYDLAKIKEGLYKSEWSGRFEVVAHDPLIIIDGAHNLEGAKALKDSLANIKKSKAIIYSALKRKDYQSMLSELKGAGDIYLTTFDHKEVFDHQKAAKDNGLEYYDNLMTALNSLKDKYECIVICGSLYFLSDFITNKTEYQL